MEFSILSLNVWDLPVALPGTKGRSRRARMIEALPAAGADVVLLQEAFRPRFRRQLAAAMTGYHADAGADAARWMGPFRMDRSGGLLTLSRWRITGTRYERSFRTRGMKPDERIGQKGVLWTHLDSPSGPLIVGNVHLYAGNRPVDARVRTAQARRLVRGADRIGRTMIVAGDFNIAREHEQPDRGPTAFDVLEQAGFREIACGASEGIETMDPRRNRWARYTPWHRPARRLTQVFHRGDVTPVGRPRVVLDDPPLSDHFGLLARFRCPPD